MIGPAPYNPDTLRYIRSRLGVIAAPAIAAELGWTVERLCGIARRHGISVSIPVEIVDKPADLPPPSHPDGIQWSRGSGRLIRFGAETRFAGTHITIFDALLRQMRANPGIYVGGDDLAGFAEIDRTRLNEIKRTIEPRLKPLLLHIESKNMQGYRLVDLSAGEGGE